jgi:regulator of protease activity HflC (stomatin/prohibitin superfamily)
MDGALAFLFVLGVLVVATLYGGVKVVPQGFQWTVERFGRYRATLTPGLNLIVPFIDRIGYKMNVQEQVLDIPSQNVITKDNAVVRVDGVVFYQVLDASRAAYEVRGLANAIVNLCMTNIRSAIGAMDLDETLSKRAEINSRLLAVLDAATQPWGTKITRVELKDVNPPDTVIEAMAKQLSADRDKRAQVLQAEGFKQSAILRAEGEKQSVILAAEARLEAARRDADARERLAEAEAKATELVSTAVRDGNTQALNYFIAQRYTDALAQVGKATNAKIVLMPLEASSVIGAIGGISELVKGAFGPDGAAPSSPSAPRGGGQRPPSPFAAPSGGALPGGTISGGGG